MQIGAKMEIKDIITILTSIVTIASVVVKLTPSKYDDTVLAKLMALLALNKK